MDQNSETRERQSTVNHRECVLQNEGRTDGRMEWQQTDNVWRRQNRFWG